MLRARGTRSRKPAVKETKPRKAGSFANPEEVKKRNTRRFMAESERLRKEGLAANKAANTRGVGGNLAAAGGAAAKRAVKEDRTKQFLAESERLRKEGLAANKAAANKRVKSTDGKSDRPSAASMRDSAAQRAALAKSEPKKESKPAKKAKVTGKGTTKKDRNVGEGASKRANVTAEQLKAAGLTGGPKGLRTYLNMYDKLGRRPKPSDFKKGPASPMAAAAKLGAKGEDEMPIKRKGGGMMKSKMKAKGMKAGGKMKAKGMAKGGMKTKGYMAGGLKDAPEGNKGLKKLPKKVRNKMGFKAKGGMMKTKGYAKGGMKTKGYAAGGMKSKMATKKKPTKQKVRGAGIARKGVRPAKMR